MCAESYRFIVINNLLLVEQQLCLVMDAMAEAFSQIKTVCTLSLSFIKTKTETVKKTLNNISENTGLHSNLLP